MVTQVAWYKMVTLKAAFQWCVLFYVRLVGDHCLINRYLTWLFHLVNMLTSCCNIDGWSNDGITTLLPWLKNIDNIVQETGTSGVIFVRAKVYCINIPKTDSFNEFAISVKNLSLCYNNYYYYCNYFICNHINISRHTGNRILILKCHILNTDELYKFLKTPPCERSIGQCQTCIFSLTWEGNCLRVVVAMASGSVRKNIAFRV